ncbi:MAG: metallophosphoesterase [Bifidobacterium sp.]|uniref:metallophosphoesterase n=1 Tax=Bifidobacterium sp. TaxID=41200 RepID=UPI0039E8F9CB
MREKRMRYGGMKVVSVLIASVMALTAGLVAKPAAAESSQASITGAMPVVMTELAVKTANGSFTDANGVKQSVNIGEFIELTNVSEKPVSVSDLSLTYNGVDWTPEAFDAAAGGNAQNPQIPAKGSVVLWDNYANVTAEGISPALSTDADFNAFWKDRTQNDPQLVMNSTLFTISKGAGMSNTSQRTLVLTQRSTHATNSVSYSTTGDTDTTINYAYDEQGIGTLSINNAATPGTTVEGQIPASWPQTSARKIVLTDVSDAPATANDSDAIKLAVKASSSDGLDSIGSVRLYTKTNVDASFADSSFDGNRSSDEWVFTIPAGKLTGKTSISYEFVATDVDGVQTVGEGATIALSAKPANEYDKATVPLVITEIAPDTANVGGADGYEFIEVTNIANRTIDFSNNYSLYYSYPEQGDSGDVEWPAVQNDITIPAGTSIVFWIKNGPNDQMTAADFNKNFGLAADKALVLGTNLFEISSAGMANNSARMLKIETKTKTLISSASYPDNASTNLTGSTHSLQYVYSAGQNETKLGRSDQAPTPGSVQDDDIRATPYSYPAAPSAPDVKDNTPTSFGSDEDLAFSFDITSKVALNRVSLFIRHAGEKTYTSHNLTKPAGSDTYGYTENKIDLIGVKDVDYYLEISDGINPVFTETAKSIVNTDFSDAKVRLNVQEGQFLRGKVTLRATGTSSSDLPKMSVDSQAIDSSDVSGSLESEPYIAAEITQTDIFFFNSFTTKTVITGTPTEDDWKDNVIGSFDDGTYGDTQTVSFPVPLEQIHDNTLSLYMNSGTKSSATDILDDQGNVNTENADNYLASNIRLVLPDGTHLKVSKAVAAVSPGATGTVTEKDVTDEVANAQSSIKIGDSSGQYEYIRLDFTIDPSSVMSSQYSWDTSKVTDGEHDVEAHAQAGEAKSQVIVDNTKPSIEPEISADASASNTLRGNIVINASASDATSGIPAADETGALSATLTDGSGEAKSITLPYKTASAGLAAGLHTVTFTVSDKAGNEATKSVSFMTYAENPTIVATDSVDGSATSDPKLSVTAQGNPGDELNVKFYAGEEYKPGNSKQVSVAAGITTQSGLATSTVGEAVSASDAAKLDDADGKVVTTTATDNGFPYQSFTVSIPDAIAKDADATTTLHWSGTAEANADIYAFVKNTATGAWDKVSRVCADEDGKVSIAQNVVNKDHVADNQMSVVVQNGAGYASGNLSDDASSENTNPNGLKSPESATTSTIDGADGNPVVTMNDDAISQEATARSDYDFTFAWESDTQYYNANYDDDGYYQHQENIHNWLINNRKAMNIQYLFHTGDIVDDADIQAQWDRADAQYKKLDDANFPYGVLAGNHDVDHKDENYVNFSKNFGESRYDSNPWYGGSFEDNRGHYDLISAGGIDFIVVSVGWGVEQDEIDWTNQILAQYPNRVAILNFHEYLLASGGLGLIPQEIYKQVVIPNKNVKMVFSGHYHSAQKTVSRIDSDGDGKPDRNVLNLLFDYQALDEGGMGFLRLMHVNTQNGTMEVRTYSPSLQKYGSQTVASSSFKPSDEEFTVDLSELGIKPRTAQNSEKRISTDEFAADLQGSTLIASANAVSQTRHASQEKLGLVRGLASGVESLSEQTADTENGLPLTAEVSWKNASVGTHGWYAVVSNQYGGTVTSPVSYVQAVEKKAPADGGSQGSDNQGSDSHAGDTTGDEGNGGSPGGSHVADGNNTPDSKTQTGSTESVYKGDKLVKTGVNVSIVALAVMMMAACGAALKRLTWKMGKR